MVIKKILRLIVFLFCIFMAFVTSYVFYGAAIESEFADGAVIFVTLLGLPVGFFVGLFLSIIMGIAIPIIFIMIIFSLLGAIIL